jgi:hypothetical protein
VLTTHTIQASEIVGADHWYSFDFNDIDVTIGTVYRINISRSVDPSINDLVIWGGSLSSYVDNYPSGAPGPGIADFDFGFRTYNGDGLDQVNDSYNYGYTLYSIDPFWQEFVPGN